MSRISFAFQTSSVEVLLTYVDAGEGVGVAVSTFMKDTTVYTVEYCAYTELRRPIFHKDQSFTAGNFEVLTHNGKTGIEYIQNVKDDINGMS